MITYLISFLTILNMSQENEQTDVFDPTGQEIADELGQIIYSIAERDLEKADALSNGDEIEDDSFPTKNSSKYR